MNYQAASEVLEEIPAFQHLSSGLYFPTFPPRIDADIDDFDDFVRHHVQILEPPPSKRLHFFPGFETHDFVCRKPMELAITQEDEKFVITNLELDAIGLGESVIEALADFMENMIDQYKLLKEFHNKNRLTQYAERLFSKYKRYLEERS